MTSPVILRLFDEAPPSNDAASEPAPPQVLTRVIATPAGAPWDQSHAADLDARLGAPLPLDELVWRLRRLDPWRPGKSARFAVFYLRARDVGDRFTARQIVDGLPLAIAFVSKRESARVARRNLFVAAGVAALVVTLIAAFSTALAIRGEAAQGLDDAEQLAATRLHQAQLESDQRRDARALDLAGVRGHDVTGFLTDLAWASQAKAPGARIQALHWKNGYMAVEVRGADTPFTRFDRSVAQAPKPLARGVRLWGVGPNTPPSPLSSPSAGGASR